MASKQVAKKVPNKTTRKALKESEAMRKKKAGTKAAIHPFKFPTAESIQASLDEQAAATDGALPTSVLAHSPAALKLLFRAFKLRLGDRVLRISDEKPGRINGATLRAVGSAGIEEVLALVTLDGESTDTALAGGEILKVKKPKKGAKVKTKPSVSGTKPTPEQVLKRCFGFAVGDRVHKGDDTITPWAITRVVFKDQTISDEIVVSLLFDLGPDTQEAESTGYDLHEIPQPKQPAKIRFSDVPFMAAFEDGISTFIKVGNGTAIAAPVRGSIDEPFVLLTPAASKIDTGAKRRFRQTDKVLPYTGE